MANSILGEILEEAVTAAKTLTLAGVGSTSIKQLGGLTATTLDNEIPARPCVIFAPFGSEDIPDGGGTNISDDITYRIVCAIIDAANQDHTAATLDAKYLWRETLIDHFIHNQLAVTISNAVLYDQTLELQPVVNLGAWEKNWFLSAFIIKCIVRKKRRA